MKDEKNTPQPKNTEKTEKVKISIRKLDRIETPTAGRARFAPGVYTS